MGQSLGQIFDFALRIQPCAEGSFVVYGGPDTASSRGFSNVTDLMTWLQRAAQAQQAAEVTQLTEAEYVASPYAQQGSAGLVTGMKDGKPVIGYEAQLAPAPKPAQWPAERPASQTMRTTALGSLADRLAAAEQPKGAA